METTALVAITAIVLGLFALLAVVAGMFLASQRRQSCYSPCSHNCEHGDEIDYLLHDLYSNSRRATEHVDSLYRLVESVESRVTTVEQRPQYVTQVTRIEHYDMRTKFNWFAAGLGAIAGLIAGLVTVVFLSEHAVPLGSTTYHYGWGLHQLPLDVMTTLFCTLTASIAAGILAGRPVNQPLVNEN